MAKVIKYDSVVARLLAERDPRDVLGMLIAILEEKNPGFFEDGLNRLFPTAEGEPHSAEYTKPV